MPSEITQGLVERLLQRDATGLRKYGVTLDRPDLTIEQWLDHQTEELLDGAGYAQSAKREIAALRAEAERQRQALQILLEWAPPDALMQFDDGDILVADFIAQAINPPTPPTQCTLNLYPSPAPTSEMKKVVS